MYAEVHGNNQGISKLYRPQDMGFNPKAGELIFENETPQSVGKFFTVEPARVLSCTELAKTGSKFTVA